jgi:hypothetical protein
MSYCQHAESAQGNAICLKLAIRHEFGGKNGERQLPELQIGRASKFAISQREWPLSTYFLSHFLFCVLLGLTSSQRGAGSELMTAQ